MDAAYLYFYEYTLDEWKGSVTYEVYTLNRHMRYHHKIGSSSVISEQQYYKRWRLVNIFPKLKSWMNTIPSHKPIYLSFRKSVDFNESYTQFHSAKQMYPFILVSKKVRHPVTAGTRRKRSTVTQACNGTNTQQPCCIQSEEINLNTRQAVLPWWLSPRSFTMKYCYGTCRGKYYVTCFTLYLSY